MLKTSGRSARRFIGAFLAPSVVAPYSVRADFASAGNTAHRISAPRKPAPAVLEHFSLIFGFGFMVNGVNGALLAHCVTPVSINNLNGGGI